MLDRFSGSMITIAIAASAQAPGVSAAAPAPAVKTPWGEPDLQGIWTDENDTPFQRSPKYADQEFFTEALIRQSGQRCPAARRQVRSDAHVARRLASSSLQHRAHEPPRRCRGRRVGGSLSDPRSARVRRHERRPQLPTDRADSRRHLDRLRRGPRARMAAEHRHERQPARAGQHPPVVRRLARPLGGQHARDRRDVLQPENRIPGFARKPAPGRAVGRGPGQPRSNTP
jgi:hypothetical protein